MNARSASLAAFLLVCSAPLVVRAEPMDLALERLVENPGACLSTDGMGRFTPRGSDPALKCFPDNLSFKRLVNQLGFALAPTAMHAARTTGLGGFDVALEAAYTSLSSDASYWRRGTQGAPDAATQRAATSNQSPASVLQNYSLKLRKGFGFGLEVAGAVGFIPQTSWLNGGVDVRMALLEGFRRGTLGILPDVALGGGVRTLTGTPELQLTTVAVDVQISKPLTILESSVLTPWIGYQYLWIFGDSGLVDLTPGTNAQQACGYVGQNVPGNADASKAVTGATGAVTNTYDGQQICRGGSARDFNNNAVFQAVRLHRQRLLFGANYRYEMLRAGAQLIADLLSPADANSAKNKADLQGEARQWTVVLELGAAF